MPEREPVDLNKLGMRIRVLGHPVALRIIALLNDHPLSGVQGSESKKDMHGEESPLEEV